MSDRSEDHMQTHLGNVELYFLEMAVHVLFILKDEDKTTGFSMKNVKMQIFQKILFAGKLMVVLMTVAVSLGTVLF